MQAIEIKYLGATNTQGVRLKASCAAGTITVPRDYAVNVDQQIPVVVGELLAKLEWDNTFVVGQLKSGNYAAVLL